tara:strand:+ start:509 stop:787 length:279 start_codon:yes stop_codon:yes gene_type:complete
VFSSTDIKALKLLGGEIVMGYVTESFVSKSVTISEAQLLVQQVVEGNMEVQLAPWLPYAREYTFEIPKSQIVTMFNVRPNLETNYKLATGNK